MRTVLVDTGAWIGLLSRNDRYARPAEDHYRQLRAEGARLLTNNYVVDETATRLRYGGGLDAALSFRRMLDEAVRARVLRIAWIDQAVEQDGWEILEQYRDVTLSLTDAVTAAGARRSRITEVFGFDGDFEAVGLVVLPGPKAR